ncbi:uncharacterized protein LOC113500639 [Trichoplusia ni]|uniref:Uncharacterized protein LOC113500639 n=1 Tax=Trichoplusia ni TaxID=7111 RepID=A0A7E5W9H9_TRINI|nr:uncharacterized protein LOC113500639 [Trichoplusia ni]
MDSITYTDNVCMDIKMSQENMLLEVIRELCGENSKLSDKLKGKVNRIIADCNLTHYSSLHRLSNPDESTATLLGFMHQTAVELTFDEQAEFNQAVLQKIQTKLPKFIAELEHLRQSTNSKKTQKSKMKELQDSIDDKLSTLEEQESEKVELMMEWLNHRLRDVTKFSDDSSELLTLKTKILDLKSKILHLQILQNIFTETNQSIKAYSEIHKDMKDSIKETEQRIKNFRDIINGDK